MDQNMREGMKMGFVISTMELAFKLTLQRLAEQQGAEAKTVVDGLEQELIAAVRNATPTPNLPNDLYVSMVDAGAAHLKQAFADVRGTLGGR